MHKTPGSFPLIQDPKYPQTALVSGYHLKTSHPSLTLHLWVHSLEFLFLSPKMSLPVGVLPRCWSAQQLNFQEQSSDFLFPLHHPMTLAALYSEPQSRVHLATKSKVKTSAHSLIESLKILCLISGNRHQLPPRPVSYAVFSSTSKEGKKKSVLQTNVTIH